MQNIFEKSKISISIFADDKWVISGKDNEVVTSQSEPELVKEFLWKNGIFPGMAAEAVKNSKKIDFRDQLFQVVEHKKESGENIFTDRGNRVTFDREIVTDDDARLALVHAQQKFGNELTLTGDDPRFKERMARLADDMGLKVLNQRQT